MRIRITTLLLILLCIACSPGHKAGEHFVSLESFSELSEYLRWHPDGTPLIGAHRGGPAPGFPENCIATFERSLAFAPCLIEIDIQKSKDDVLLLLHDDDLSRTTTGEGGVPEYTLAELKELNLVDGDGMTTEYRIPTLAEALEWARGKAILELDFKRPVMPAEIVQSIQKHEAHSYTIVITYNWHTAELFYQLDPEIVISCSAQGMEGVDYLLQSLVPPENLIAFVGVSEPSSEVYQALHRAGIRTILGTMGNLDRSADANGVKVYIDLLRNGADVLATDNVASASKAIDAYLKSRK
ncbi:MAG: glycerophosphodiester phosphodiesterase family protein [Candidatus Eisenbacteria bacterium]|uniref:Glycerophosphodiester phosphodiesterase family protein n=1 Tax=Eiseniibacteriota bacterium TaxID=2212470 RepID=A0A948W3E9_UNCEI|nr:glycerophosphodiester phosphodiesterase family protein [Candidatus Eisenbacteria bacterium]MBU1951258.1 glycerophosphodiester phosphodiesterase family protein [Candidatus Eisenbacteria bacterium]MBU2691012.1 glycerophosphodiester phosphodiesterase family protein [Candidatus Eisenbacteria bacterium]